MRYLLLVCCLCLPVLNGCEAETRTATEYRVTSYCLLLEIQGRLKTVVDADSPVLTAERASEEAVPESLARVLNGSILDSHTSEYDDWNLANLLSGLRACKHFDRCPLSGRKWLRLVELTARPSPTGILRNVPAYPEPSEPPQAPLREGATPVYPLVARRPASDRNYTRAEWDELCKLLTEVIDTGLKQL